MPFVLNLYLESLKGYLSIEDSIKNKTHPTQRTGWEKIAMKKKNAALYESDISNI